MLKLKQTLNALLVATVAAGLWAGQAGAQNLDLSEMAAALVVPIVSGAHTDLLPGDPKLTNPRTAPNRGDVVIPNANSATTLATITNGMMGWVTRRVWLAMPSQWHRP